MSHAVMRRAVAAVSGAALAALGLGVGVASAAPGSVTWDDGSERITRTISDVTPAAGDTITSTTAFDRTGGVVEYIQQVKDIHPPCLTYVEGSAKVDGSPRGLDSQGADFAKVTGSWALYPHISPNLRTFEFSYKVGADCARGVPLMTTVHYSGTLGSGTYEGKGPTVSVAETATTTTLTVPATANVGAAVELKATVAPAAAGGTVQFKDGAANIGGPVAVNAGVATLSHSFDAAGAKSITAVYSGGAGFTGSTSAAATVTVSVPDEVTTTTITVPATANVGAAVELKATVAPAAAAGTVQFKDGAASIGGPVTLNAGVATLSHTFDAAGAKSITAVYSGGAGFTGSTSPAATVTVSVADVATSTQLTVPATAFVGAPAELKATVSPAPAGGTVQFKNGDLALGAPVNVVDGKAVLSHTFAAAGSHAISAVFSGAPGFLGSTSAVQSVSVPVPDVVTSIVLTAPATADRGVVVEFSAVVSPTPTGGTVQFKDGATPIGGPVNVVDGKAKLSHTFDSPGAHSISATYSGFAGFSGAGSQASTVTVAGAGGDGSFGSSQFGS
jgi:hypothetical protein